MAQIVLNNLDETDLKILSELLKNAKLPTFRSIEHRTVEEEPTEPTVESLHT